MKDHTKEYRLTCATDKETFNTVKDIALESLTTTSQLIDIWIKRGIILHEPVSPTRVRHFNMAIFTDQSEELMRKLRNYDEFYQFKRNIAEICLILNGNLGPIYEDGMAGTGIQSLIDLFNDVKVKEPALFKECIPILKKNLNKAQRDLIVDAVY